MTMDTVTPEQRIAFEATFNEAQEILPKLSKAQVRLLAADDLLAAMKAAAPTSIEALHNRGIFVAVDVPEDENAEILTALGAEVRSLLRPVTSDAADAGELETRKGEGTKPGDHVAVGLAAAAVTKEKPAPVGQRQSPQLLTIAAVSGVAEDVLSQAIKDGPDRSNRAGTFADHCNIARLIKRAWAREIMGALGSDLDLSDFEVLQDGALTFKVVILANGKPFETGRVTVEAEILFGQVS